MARKKTPAAKAFSERLAHVLRIEKQLGIESTDAEIASEAGVSLSAFYNWRSGSSRPAPDNLARLCERRGWSCLLWLTFGRGDAPTDVSLLESVYEQLSRSSPSVTERQSPDRDLRAGRSELLPKLRSGLETMLRPLSPLSYETPPASLAVAADRLRVLSRTPHVSSGRSEAIARAVVRHACDGSLHE